MGAMSTGAAVPVLATFRALARNRRVIPVTRRLLADPRSQALVSNFAQQLLYLRNLPTTAPDGIFYPNWDDELRKSFRRETELLFQSIIQENRSVLDLLNADYTFLNERLAKHYGIQNILYLPLIGVTFGVIVCLFLKETAPRKVRAREPSLVSA